MYFPFLRRSWKRIAEFTVLTVGERCCSAAQSSVFSVFVFGNQRSISQSKMPKKDKTAKKNTRTQTEAAAAVTCPVSMVKDGALAIAVHAKPGAKQNAVTDVSSEAVGVAIAAPPTDGEANAELVRYLAKVLELKKSEISLDKGSKSREKIIKVTASISKEEVLERLKREAAG